jgi:hypothetical protein
MTPTRASSTSSSEAGDLPLGSVVAGFVVERVIGRGSRSVVYEAAQVGLERRVALKLVASDPELEARSRCIEWPDHPHVVRLYAAGACEQGQFFAMQLIPGPTLATLVEAGELEPAGMVRALTDVAAALDAAHAAGIVHGCVSLRNVLVAPGGNALLSDFGLGAADASAESDRAAFAALVRDCLGDFSPAPTAAGIVRAAAATLPEPERASRRGWRARLLEVGALAVAAALVAVLAWPDTDTRPVPPVLQGAQALGSSLAAAGVDSVDCDGRPPAGGSPHCILVQTKLPGRRLSVSRAGAIRRWAVRGARGKLALEVLRRRGQTFEAVARTPYVRIPDAGLNVLPANLSIRPGDVVGLQVTPGAAVGVSRAVEGAATARSFAALAFTARRVDHPEGTGFDHEVLLRVEYVPGARAALRGVLSGQAAARAPAGRQLSSRDVETGDGTLRTVALVRVADRIAVELLDAERRLVRLPVADAHPRGRLMRFDTLGEPTVRLRWRNPGGEVVGHDYAVGSRSIAPSS